MMDTVTYNIPIALFPDYIGRRVIVRSADPAEIVQQLAGQDIDNVQYAQLLTADVTTDAIDRLSNWEQPVPLDIVLDDPSSQFPLLYNFSKLLDRCPIRVTIPVRSGFFKAVKLALALNFAVKLDVGQPDAEMIDELNEILDLYLHRPNVSQPVEFFHSVFLSIYNEQPASLWMIQEEDADNFRFVADDGDEAVSSRFGGLHPDVIVRNVENNAEHTGDYECDTCEFLPVCGGYFKWPDHNYSCEGVKSIFATITAEAAELRENVASIKAIQEGAQ